MKKQLSELKEGDVIKADKLKGAYVVVESKKEKQTGSHNESDWWAWMVKLSKLDKNGCYNVRAKHRKFYDSSGFIDDYVLKEVEVIGKMKKKVAYELVRVKRNIFV